ncbi:MAG TPA: FkbM family methyltransferase [Acidimicrobiales bacterium]|nr:FkbM family methyltransferase [Acidimicrobiales bacterium]
MRAIGAVCGAVPGWYMLLVEPSARKMTDVPPMRVHNGGALMELDLNDFVQRKHYARAYERRELRFVRSWCRNGDYVVDVGANVGILTIAAAKRVGPRGAVLAIEPVPANVDRLTTNVALNHAVSIEVKAVAAGATGGFISIGLSEWQNHVGNSGAFSLDGHTRAVQVPVKTIDELVSTDGNASRVRLLKIDVEGMERAVLEGATRSLCRTDAVLLEWNPTMATDAAALEILRAGGFSLHRLAVGARLVDLNPIQHSHARSAEQVSGRWKSVLRWLRGDGRLVSIVAIRNDSPENRRRETGHLRRR